MPPATTPTLAFGKGEVATTRHKIGLATIELFTTCHPLFEIFSSPGLTRIANTRMATEALLA